MDRFIGQLGIWFDYGKNHLKSNMDRFIGFYYENGCSIIPNLKSNMDRFIDKELFFYEMFSHI